MTIPCKNWEEFPVVIYLRLGRIWEALERITPCFCLQRKPIKLLFAFFTHFFQFSFPFSQLSTIKHFIYILPVDCGKKLILISLWICFVFFHIFHSVSIWLFLGQSLCHLFCLFLYIFVCLFCGPLVHPLPWPVRRQ